MEFKELYKVLMKNKYYIFSYEDILSFYPHEDRDSIKTMLYRWNQKGWIYHLKRGLYELTYPDDFTVPDMYVANRVYGPSYVSLETALSYYSIIPEVAMGVSSITTKPTRRFKNKHGLFTYRTVKTSAFRGYYVERHGNFDIFIAEPEKAFADYLYFKTYRKRKINLKDERVDIEVISKFNRKKISKYAKAYNLNIKEIYAHL